MSKQKPAFEWQMIERDADWDQVCASYPTPPTLIRDRSVAQQRLGGVVVVLLLLVSAGYGWWRTTQTNSQHAAAEVQATAQKVLVSSTPGDGSVAASFTGNPTGANWWLHHAQKYSALRAAIEDHAPVAHLDVAFHTVEFQGDQAVADVVTLAKGGASAYRQTRFYRRTDAGWLSTAPDAALWGAQRSLETLHFVFHFRQNDAQAVIAFAPQIDELYTTMRRNFGLPIMPTSQKLEIEVSVTEPPGHAIASLRAPNRILVPSPAVYLAPVELSDEELLVQSVALPLLANSLAEASHQHRMNWYWQPLVNALHLWQVWDVELPLAAWREEVVTWLYFDLPTSYPGQAAVLPEHYTELCAAHKLWLPAPMEINIPLLCAELNWEDAHLSPQVWIDPPVHLDELVFRSSAELIVDPPPASHPGRTVALATLIEYAVATYGRDRLPLLVAGLGQYDSWETLLPAVYGVSPTEFEAGWQAYLTTHYGK